MKYIVYILLFFPVWVTAQTYKYIGIEDGLSNRRIFNIQKDAQGYMWFLTNEGMDRYNGKDIKHYKLNKEGTILDAPIRLGWLYTEPHIGIWVVGKQGRVFQYEADRDDFKMVYTYGADRITIGSSVAPRQNEKNNKGNNGNQHRRKTLYPYIYLIKSITIHSFGEVRQQVVSPLPDRCKKTGSYPAISTIRCQQDSQRVQSCNHHNNEYS